MQAWKITINKYGINLNLFKLIFIYLNQHNILTIKTTAVVIN